jgi:hypothetical protein
VAPIFVSPMIAKEEKSLENTVNGNNKRQTANTINNPV